MIPKQETLPTSRYKKYYCIVSIVLLLAGASLSLYLFSQSLQLLTNESQGIVDVCSSVFGKSCNHALQSNYSSVLGLSLAGWGILFYAALLLFFIAPFLFGRQYRTAADFFVTLLLCAGVLAAIALLIIMLVKPRLFCPLCSIIHLINILLFFFARPCFGCSFKDLFKLPATFFSKAGFKNLKYVLRSIAATSIILLFLSSLFFLLYAKNISATSSQGMLDVKPILKKFDAEKKLNIPIKPGDIVFGNPESKTTLVVFSDFFCYGCHFFSSEFDTITQRYKDSVLIVFKHFPLNSICNPKLKKDIHPQACAAALAAEAAYRQGKFLPYHDSLFATYQDENPAKLYRIAKNLQLNMEQFDKDIRSSSAKIKVSTNIAEANELGINGTPAIFLNGRQITDFRRGVPTILLKREMKEKRQ